MQKIIRPFAAAAGAWRLKLALGLEEDRERIQDNARRESRAIYARMIFEKKGRTVRAYRHHDAPSGLTWAERKRLQRALETPEQAAERKRLDAESKRHKRAQAKKPKNPNFGLF